MADERGTSQRRQKKDPWRDPVQVWTAGFLGVAAVGVFFWANARLYDEPKPRPMTTEELRRACETDRVNQQLALARQMRAEAELVDAQVGANASSPELKAHYQASLEKEVGLARGEGHGSQAVYEGRVSEAKARLAEIEPTSTDTPGSCLRYEAALLGAKR